MSYEIGYLTANLALCANKLKSAIYNNVGFRLFRYLMVVECQTLDY